MQPLVERAATEVVVLVDTEWQLALTGTLLKAQTEHLTQVVVVAAAVLEPSTALTDLVATEAPVS